MVLTVISDNLNMYVSGTTITGDCRCLQTDTHKSGVRTLTIKWPSAPTKLTLRPYYTNSAVYILMTRFVILQFRMSNV